MASGFVHPGAPRVTSTVVWGGNNRLCLLFSVGRYRSAMTSESPWQEIRIGDAEREDAIQRLGDLMASGHLDIDEYDKRTSAATAARTGADLDALFTDLPGPHQQPPPPMAPSGLPIPAPPMPPASGPAASPLPMVPAPHGVDAYGRPLSDKNRWIAGALQLTCSFGVGRFYAGDTGTGVAQLILSFCGVGVFWCWVDGIIYLTQGGTDGDGKQLQS